MATLNLLLTGEPEWGTDALIEMMAAYGIAVGEMTSDDRAGLARYANSFSAEVMSGAVLAQIATETRCTGSRRQFPGREKPPGKR